MKLLKLLSFTIVLSFTALASNRINNSLVVPYEMETTDSFCSLAPSIKLHYYITKYCDIYNVPYNIAFGVANSETGYKGVLHNQYNPRQISSAKAYGAMQIKVPTAKGVALNKLLTSRDLLNNLELNVAIGIKLLADLRNTYGSWPRALGAYNTGYPIINRYACRIYHFDTQKHFICPKTLNRI